MAQWDESNTHKSAPNTANTAAGNPNAQYVELVLINANRRGAMEVMMHPIATRKIPGARAMARATVAITFSGMLRQQCGRREQKRERVRTYDVTCDTCYGHGQHANHLVDLARAQDE